MVQLEHGSALTYFYFDINDESKQTENNLLSSLVLTFTAISKRYALLNCLYKKYHQIHTPTNFDLLNLLKELVIGCKKSYIVIDALDECAAHGKLFDVINVIHGWQISSFHLLVTSRSEQRIVAEMQNHSPQEIYISPDLIGNDIISYINFTIGNEHELNRWDPSTQVYIKATLVNGANGMCVHSYCRN